MGPLPGIQNAASSWILEKQLCTKEFSVTTTVFQPLFTAERKKSQCISNTDVFELFNNEIFLTLIHTIAKKWAVGRARESWEMGAYWLDEGASPQTGFSGTRGSIEILQYLNFEDSFL